VTTLLHLALVVLGDIELDLHSLVAPLVSLRLDERRWHQKLHPLSCYLGEIEHGLAPSERPSGGVVGVGGLVGGVVGVGGLVGGVVGAQLDACPIDGDLRHERVVDACANAKEPDGTVWHVARSHVDVD
jgi:hypothetical protein